MKRFTTRLRHALHRALHIGSWVKKHFYVVTWTVDFLMLPIFLVCLVTGIIMFPGFLELVHVRARNVPFDTIQFLHDWSGLSLGAGILLHLGLHWRATLQFVRSKILHLPPRRAKQEHRAHAVAEMAEERV